MAHKSTAPAHSQSTVIADLGGSHLGGNLQLRICTYKEQVRIDLRSWALDGAGASQATEKGVALTTQR